MSAWPSRPARTAADYLAMAVGPILIMGMVGFGGMFAVYTYISTTLTDVSGLSRSLVPLALACS